MSTNPEDYVADSFHMLISNAQENELRDFEQARADERHAAQALRQEQGAGLSASDLLAKLAGDSPEERMAKLDVENARLQQEAADAVAARQVPEEALPADRFPAPTITSPG